MSLVRVFRKKSAVFVTLLAIALLLAPTLAVTAYDGHNSHSLDHHSNDNLKSTDHHTYSLGTVCGDALAGKYSVSSFSGMSKFHGWGVSFSVSDMSLSGGASGTVTSGVGSVRATGDGGKMLSATFTGMTGTYHIVGGSMHVDFSVNNLQVDGVSLGTLHLPITMSCNTPDSAV